MSVWKTRSLAYVTALWIPDQLLVLGSLAFMVSAQPMLV